MALVTLQQAVEVLVPIPLRHAILCIECESLHDARKSRACPFCGSDGCLSLSRVLDAPRIAPQAHTEPV